MARVERLSVVEVAVLEVAPASRFQSDPASWRRRRVGSGIVPGLPLVEREDVPLWISQPVSELDSDFSIRRSTETLAPTGCRILYALLGL
jgi:hypothetical protein